MGKGSTFVLFVVWDVPSFEGTFFKLLRNYGYNFHNFHILRIYGCSFQGIVHNFQNYGPDFHSICVIMALKSNKIDGIKATSFSDKLARPRQIIG